MKKKKIFIAVLAAAVLALAPARSHAQIEIEPVGGSWGGFTNSGIVGNSQSSGSWGGFNNEDPCAPYAPLGGGLAWLTVAGIGYACAKRRKADKG